MFDDETKPRCGNAGESHENATQASYSSLLKGVQIKAMAILRAVAIFAMLIFFFTIAAPLQWLVLRTCAQHAHHLPRLFNILLLGLLKVKVRTHGASAAKAGSEAPHLIVANHVSWTDIPALNTSGRLCFLAKREVSTWPIISTFAHLQRTVFVDRGKRKSILEANAAMAERMRDHIPIVLFPEGTTHDGTQVGHFHSSHFGAIRDIFLRTSGEKALRVQPIAIRYSASHAAWCGDALLLPHLMGLINGETITCELLYCEPLLFDGSADRKALAQECSRRIEAMLATAPGLPAAEHRTTDMLQRA